VIAGRHWRALQVNPGLTSFVRTELSKNISTKGPRNCRSLGFPGFPADSCGFGQLHVVLFRENHISGAGESCEVGNPAALGMTKGGVATLIEVYHWERTSLSPPKCPVGHSG
jgi:hypothetical protein